jgi:hypothetical protein
MLPGMSSLDVRSIEQEALDLTRELCRKPSVSAEERALGETADLVETLLTATGFQTRQLTVDGAPPAVYGELGGDGDATLLLYNHSTSSPSIRSSSGSHHRSSRRCGTAACTRGARPTTRPSLRFGSRRFAPSARPAARCR